MLNQEAALAAGRGFVTFCGTDEAGRGPLAGPVYAAAVFLGASPPDGINDSKKLSPKRREQLFEEIRARCVTEIAFSTVEEIDSSNILAASQQAMVRAVEGLMRKVKLDGVLVDGNIARGFPIPALCVIGGDAKCLSIAAASILAKVARDREMIRLDERYPGYGLAKHKGYPTPDHYEALRLLGPSPIHRRTFLKNMDPHPQSPSKQRGQLGESIAVDFLTRAGHQILQQNFRSYTGEIDIVSRHKNILVFTEVKLRKNARFAQAAESVIRSKIQKIKKTAAYWLGLHPTELQPRFDVLEIYLEDRPDAAAEIHHIIGAFE